MKKLLIALLLAGCGAPIEPPPPAPSDATTHGIDAGGTTGNTFNVAVGEPCSPDPSALCAKGAGACVAGVCRAWCGDPPSCPAGTVRQDTTIDGAAACVCVPQ